jgi:membrane associated rhomboid family serine protease
MNPGVRLTPAVRGLLIGCFVIYVVQLIATRGLELDFVRWFGLVPSEFGVRFKIWQLFSYSFLHGDVWHLALNLLVLAFMGGELEANWGTGRFLRFYFFCVAFAGAVYLLLQFFVWGVLDSPLVGASGGIYGLLMAYGLIFGERMMLAMMMFPMKAKHFVWILVVMQLLGSFSGGGGALSAAAHLGGMAGGFLYLYVVALRRVRARQRGGGPGQDKPKKRKGNHLKLVINNARQGLAEPNDDLDSSGPKTWH